MPDRKHALVVDEAVLALAFQEFFESQGLRVSTASGEAEAVGLLTTVPFDVVITDLMLPKGNGMDLIAEIRRNGDFPPIIVITSDDGAVHELIRVNNIQILHKPAAVTDLLDALDTVLQTPSPYRLEVAGTG
ncbi:response regulator [Azospirillum agricola]|uniref:response regulator n=1 Tax=Azospirillum agricola TaxID=1720247 RepID=UPI000A0F0A82|nr:response regulator [Azospirillum agricola]SMH43428.1 Response regulator receiver domain-containing protein [Azospirillum lipoferum]